jgi:glycosyltransferase involved in cell wall biosynthesis
MFFCWAEQLRIELLHWPKYLQEYPHNFIIAPLININDRIIYNGPLSELGRKSKNIAVSPIYLKSRNSRFRNLLNPSILISDFSSVFRVFNRSKPDVVVCFYIIHAFPLLLLKKIFGFSLSVIAMGSDINLDNNLIQRLVKKFVYPNCSLIFARSSRLKETIEKEHSGRIIVLSSGADVSFFRPLNSKRQLRQKWGIKPESHVILTVCRLDKNKGVDVLIKSIPKISDDNIRLLIVGEGAEERTLRALVRTLGIQAKVTFLGFRRREELLELYTIADLFTLASYSEGLPRVLIEAMACECIPIITNVGDAAEVVSDGYSGYLLEPGDPDGFAEKIKEIIGLPGDRLRLIQRRARESVVTRFDKRSLVKLMINEITNEIQTQKPSV